MVISGVRECVAVLTRVFAYYRKLRRRPDPTAEWRRLVAGQGPRHVEDLLAQLEPAWADHAIACVYALLMPRAKRKRLGAFFTPPHLVNHLLGRMYEFGFDPTRQGARDPAAGGAAFLVPLARSLARKWFTAGVKPEKIVARLRAQLRGREIEPGLAELANTLVRRMLIGEIGLSRRIVAGLSLVEVGDSLQLAGKAEVGHELGNPPYLRLGAAAHRRWAGRFSDIAKGRLNLYALFVRSALDQIPAGGLIGHILPASFVGGPEFATFRRRVMQLAEILVLDVVERRDDVFLDAQQDACFIVLRRRATPCEAPMSSTAASGILRHDGSFELSCRAVLRADGSPWILGGETDAEATATLAEYGYRGIVGHLVANRQPERLFKRAARGRVPLAWAKSVRPDGIFDFDRGRNAEKASGNGFVSVPDNASYIIRDPCVLVQRTSASSQSRRLTAAAVPAEFLARHGGLVGENHVIALVPTRPDAVSAPELAAVLNARAANAAMARVCRTASISVRVLERLPLPPPPRSAVAASGRKPRGSAVRATTAQPAAPRTTSAGQGAQDSRKRHRESHPSRPSLTA